MMWLVKVPRLCACCKTTVVVSVRYPLQPPQEVLCRACDAYWIRWLARQMRGE